MDEEALLKEAVRVMRLLEHNVTLMSQSSYWPENQEAAKEYLAVLRRIERAHAADAEGRTDSDTCPSSEWIEAPALSPVAQTQKGRRR